MLSLFAYPFSGAMNFYVLFEYNLTHKNINYLTEPYPVH